MVQLLAATFDVVARYRDGPRVMLDYGAREKDSDERARPPASMKGGGDRPPASRDLMALALRNRLFILAMALAFAAGGFALTKLLTPRYVAVAQIYLDPRGLPGFEGDANQGQDSTGFINFVETQTRIITSQVVLERVVAALKLEDDPEFSAGGSLLARLLGRAAGATSREEQIDGAVRSLGARVVVRRPERTFIIDIAVASSDAQKAARLANAVAQAYIDVRSAMHSDAARQAASSFTARLDGLRERLLSAEKSVEAYKAENGFIGTRDGYVDEQSLKELNQQLAYARTRLEDARARYEQIERASRSGTELAAIAASLNLVTLNALRGQQAEAAQKLADLSAELGPRHPVVRNMEARLAETRRLVSVELARVVGSARKDYERARGTQEALNGEVRKLEEKAVSAGRASVKLRDLEREVEVNRSIYESFLTRSRQTGEARELDSASTHVITMATPPTARNFPPGGTMMTGAGFVAGLALGVGVVFLRDRARASGGGGAGSGAGRDPERFVVSDATQFTSRGPGGSGAALDMTRLGIPFVRPFADRREIEAVAAGLAALARGSKGPVVIGLLGDAPGLLRSVMAVNVSLALRHGGRSVALVDADRAEAALTILVEDGLGAIGDGDSPFVEDRDGVLMALPSIDRVARAGALERIVDGLRRNRPRAVDIVLCDGAGEEIATRLDGVALVLGRDQDEAKALAAIPEPLRGKLGLVLRVEHSDPWMRRRGARRSQLRKSA